MLAIRMQRLGRKGHPTYRVVVQDSRQAPTSGKVVAQLGSYDPHTKQARLNTEKAAFYLKNGAQPSDRVVSLLKREGVVLPAWVSDPAQRERGLRNPEKLRKNQPVTETPETEVTTEPEAATEEPTTEAAEASTDATEEVPAEATTEEASK